MSFEIGCDVEILLENKELMDSPRDNQHYLRVEISWRLCFVSKNRA
jgi:hypothetical protein